MSLSDTYNPKERYGSIELADLQGTHLEFVNPEPTPHCRSQDFTCTHATALDLTWITKPLEGPNSGWDMAVPLISCGIPQEGTVQQTSSNFLARNDGPNEALEYVQASEL